MIDEEESQRPPPLCSFIHAIVEGDVSKVEQLTKDGQNIAVTNSWALYLVCVQGINMIKALMQIPTTDFNQEVPLGNGQTIHHLLRTPAIDFTGSKVETVQYLLQTGIDPFCRDLLGDTALHILAGPVQPSIIPSTESSKVVDTNFEVGLELESIKLLKIILAMISDGAYVSTSDPVNMISDYGNTALVVALLYRNVPGARLLLEHGADPRVRGELDCS